MITVEQAKKKAEEIVAEKAKLKQQKLEKFKWEFTEEYNHLFPEAIAESNEVFEVGVDWEEKFSYRSGLADLGLSECINWVKQVVGSNNQTVLRVGLMVDKEIGNQILWVKFAISTYFQELEGSLRLYTYREDSKDD